MFFIESIPPKPIFRDGTNSDKVDFIFFKRKLIN